jgi:hypothetical protein
MQGLLWRWVCSPSLNPGPLPASLCSAIFGYNSQPTFIDVFFYLGYWIVILLIGLYKYHAGTLLDADWKHNKAIREMKLAGDGFAPLPEPIKPQAAVKTIGLDHAESSNHADMEMSAAIAGAMGSGSPQDPRSASEDSSAGPTAPVQGAA